MTDSIVLRYMATVIEAKVREDILAALRTIAPMCAEPHIDRCGPGCCCAQGIATAIRVVEEM